MSRVSRINSLNISWKFVLDSSLDVKKKEHHDVIKYYNTLLHWYDYTQWSIVEEKLFIGKVQWERRWEFLVVYFWCQKSKYNHSCLPLTKMHWFGWSIHEYHINIIHTKSGDRTQKICFIKFITRKDFIYYCHIT